MKISAIATAFALCTSALASPTLEGRATSCKNADINTIKSNENSPVAFCYSYLSGSKKTASYHKLKAAAVSSACGCITASATACTATKTKIHTVTETNIVTIKSTETKWKTKTDTKISTVVQPSISVSTKTITPTGCNVVSCVKSTVTSIAMSTVTPKCSQTCIVRSCPQSIITSTASAATLTVTPNFSQTCPQSVLTTTLAASTVMLSGDASTVTQYSTISVCPSLSLGGSPTSTLPASIFTTSFSPSEMLTSSTSTSTLPSSTVCSVSGNLLPNGNFETGSLSPWSSNVIMGDAPTYFGIVSPGHNSNNALKAEWQNRAQGGISISQTFATTPGATYDFSFSWMMNNNDDGEVSYIWCKNTDQSFSDIVFSRDLEDGQVNTWVLANDDRGKLVAEGESTTIECQMVGSEGTVMWIDDIHLGCE